MKRFFAGLAVASLMLPQLAQAQDAGRPDEGNSWKYFYFQKNGVSSEEARADVIQCYRYTENLTVPKNGSNPTYMSVPYGGNTGIGPGAAAAAGVAGALAGAIITGFMDAGERRAMGRTNLRKCFGFKGYDRYELTKEQHEDLHEGEPDIVRARLVDLATGPTPSAERLVP